MHTRALRKAALTLTFWLALHAASLKAQTIPFSFQTSPPSTITLALDSYGVLSATGTFGTSNQTLSLSGAGTRMFWYPGKAAFRAGAITARDSETVVAWDNENIGEYSVAFGLNSTASGFASMAWGNSSTASGRYSFAEGQGAQATKQNAVAFGTSTASSYGAFAVGGSNTASGWYAAAWGAICTASGYYATAFGLANTASGIYSTASGLYSKAIAMESFVIGQFNVGKNAFGGNASPTTWVPIDPLFEIGNGNYGTASNNYLRTYSDALVVYKNGNATLQGTLTTPSVIVTAPSGDIPMYQGH